MSEMSEFASRLVISDVKVHVPRTYLMSSGRTVRLDEPRLQDIHARLLIFDHRNDSGRVAFHVVDIDPTSPSRRVGVNLPTSGRGMHSSQNDTPRKRRRDGIGTASEWRRDHASGPDGLRDRRPGSCEP